MDENGVGVEIVSFRSTVYGSLMSAGGEKERLNCERNAHADGSTSTGGVFRWIGWSSHIRTTGDTGKIRAEIGLSLKLKINGIAPCTRDLPSEIKYIGR